MMAVFTAEMYAWEALLVARDIHLSHNNAGCVQHMEVERKRSAETLKLANGAAAEERERVAALETKLSTLEKRLQEERVSVVLSVCHCYAMHNHASLFRRQQGRLDTGDVHFLCELCGLHTSTVLMIIQLHTCQHIPVCMLIHVNVWPQDAKAKLQRQLSTASKVEADLRSQLSRSEAARQEQERRLEGAASQVAAMRSELTMLNSRLAARDEQLLKHVEVRSNSSVLVEV